MTWSREEINAYEGFGASFNREDNSWHFYSMPGARPLGLTLKGYDGVDFVISALRRSLAERKVRGT